jgi:hypothetical protein
MTYFVEFIEKTEHNHLVKLHQGNEFSASSKEVSGLLSSDSLTIKETPYELSQLVRALTNFNIEQLNIFFEERGQLELGHYLYRQIFPSLKKPEALKNLHNRFVDLRIIADDEFINQIPWVLLAHNGIFLSTAGWAISLARRSANLTDCTLPTYPKMLIVAPQPEGSGWRSTQAQSHIEELENKLVPYNYRLSQGDHMQVATNWEQFCALAKSEQPDIIYYYGHGKGDQDQSKLIFTSGEINWIREKSMTDFAQVLRNLEKPPQVVYLNCCSGDAGGFLGAGRQLGDFIPAVVTNRTVTQIKTAQAQALAFWYALLVDAQPPHIAMTYIRTHLAEQDLSYQDFRWLIPVLHAQYNQWQYKPANADNKLMRDPYWHLKLDRVSQFGTVSFETRQMLREKRPRSFVYIWYGQPGQGIDIFHKRLTVDLREDLPARAHFLEIKPEWPAEYHNPERSFADMMCEAFDVARLEDIPGKIRSKTRGAAGKQTLVYVRHQPVRSKNVLDPAHLKQYIIWWDKKFAPLLENRVFSLLTVSFEVNIPVRFYDSLVNRDKFYNIHTDRTIVRILDEMEKVALKDLYDFLQAHEVRLPLSHKDRILQEILSKTDGHYEMTVDQLKVLVSRELDQIDANEDEYDDDDYDY